MIPLLQTLNSEVINNKSNCQNLALRFNFYINWDKPTLEPGMKPSKDDLLNSNPANVSELNQILKSKVERQKNILQSLKENGYVPRYASVQSISRLAIGMGNPNPSENGLTFQMPLGYPIIPGSAQKGVTLSYAREVAGCDEDTLKKVFGFEKGKGNVFFFDAFPVAGDNILEADIMNPHYGDYYTQKGKTPPADYLSPNPIFFLTIRAGTKFLFSMAALDNETLNLAWNWLKEALSIFGIGGKTCVGYGRFTQSEFDNYSPK